MKHVGVSNTRVLRSTLVLNDNFFFIIPCHPFPKEEQALEIPKEEQALETQEMKYCI